MKRKIRVAIGIAAVMSLSLPLLTHAAEQSPRWHEQSGTWYLKNEQDTGNIINSWFQDLDGSWYLLAPGDGHMYAGLIHDTLTDRWYYCQTEHDGWYGRMAHEDGTYAVNGQKVQLTFTQEHNGYFGAITSGLDSLRGTGIATQDVSGIPTESESSLSSSSDLKGVGVYVDKNGILRDEYGRATIFTEELMRETIEANKDIGHMAPGTRWY